MKIIEFLIKTDSPVAFADKSSDSILYATKNYIPGSAVRGALANEYIKKYKPEIPYKDERFFDLFLSGKVRFLPAYPLGAEEMAAAESFVMPLSIMRSKDGSKVIDLASDANISPRFKKLNGYLLKAEDGFYKPEADLKIEMHMSRSGEDERIKGSSKDGKIFNYEYIEPEQIFKGAFISDDEVAASFETMLVKLKRDTLYLGKSKNAQYGKCRFKVLQTAPADAETFDLAKRIYLLALTPYIPFGDWQRADEAAAELLNELEEALKNDVQLETENLKIFAAAESINGYVSVWRTKKANETAISAGSLMEMKGNLTADLLAKIKAALCAGFGKNTAEGFGQFRLWQPRDKFVVKEFAVQKPKAELNGEVKSKAATILRKLVLLQVRRQAAEDAKINVEETGKHILKRVEWLMDGNNGKAAIQNEIKNTFKDTAKNNLKKLYLNNNNLYEILTEQNGAVQPYTNINWVSRTESVTDELKNLFGEENIKPDENEVFKEYWLWFMRHAAKGVKNSD